MEGWLTKQGGRVRSWKKRWFSIKGAQLVYFKYPSDSEPQGAINLATPDGSYQCEVRYIPADEEPKKKYCFEISSNNDKQRTYYCHAASSKEAEKWVDALNRIVYATRGGGMFGTELSRQLLREGRKNGAVPYVIEACVKRIKQDGLDVVGIFRLPGSHAEVKELKQAFSQARLPPIHEADVHSVASLLKEYLRQLPEPLLTYGLYDSFMDITQDMKQHNGSKDVELLKPLVKSLPYNNFTVLKYLCEFLEEVAAHSAVNKMSLVNIATVFAPNFCTTKDTSAEALIRHTPLVHSLTMAFIRHHVELFSEPPPLDDVVLKREETELMFDEFDGDEDTRGSRGDSVLGVGETEGEMKALDVNMDQVVLTGMQGPIRRVQQDLISTKKENALLKQQLEQVQVDVNFHQHTYEKEKQLRLQTEHKLKVLVSHMQALNIALPNIDTDFGVESDDEDE
eukprot:m.125893 g.125893  ORF g.125893 m.125893 type:complete len:453 (-) comp12986_c0_seq3:1771-3129(-)